VAISQADVIIIGGGAAGLMCAISAGSRGKKVIVLDHAKQVGSKILMSGGGRCNFSNYEIEASNYISNNPHFCKSALSRYTQWDFISLVEKHQIAYHEKTLGQLFCDNKAKDILALLLDECQQHRVTIETKCDIKKTIKMGKHYKLQTSKGEYLCQALVVATGGLSIPTMGATGLGYQIAEQFGHNLYPRLPALVPFTLNPKMLKDFNGLSGTSIFVEETCNQQSFKENLLLTHRGISGPVILQISSYWQAGDEITINLLPNNDIYNDLKQAQQHTPNSQLNTLLSEYFSKKLATRLCELWFNHFYEQAIANLSDKQLQNIAKHLHHWCFKPAGTEGYRKAEVTLGGINTDEISSKTFESKKTEGLYFIGEVLDVTGQLGGYNFQWAWASGHATGQSI